MLPTPELATFLQALERQLDEIDQRMRQSEAERQKVQRQAELVRELLGREQQGDGPGTTFKQALQDVLREAPGPLHLSAIREGLASRDVQVPGQGSDANIIAYLRRIPGVGRVAKGTYGLVAPESAPEQIEKQRPRRRRKRRRAAK